MVPNKTTFLLNRLALVGLKPFNFVHVLEFLTFSFPFMPEFCPFFLVFY